jgi:hypothetical protein
MMEIEISYSIIIKNRMAVVSFGNFNVAGLPLTFVKNIMKTLDEQQRRVQACVDKLYMQEDQQEMPPFPGSEEQSAEQAPAERPSEDTVDE